MKVTMLKCLVILPGCSLPTFQMRPIGMFTIGTVVEKVEVKNGESNCSGKFGHITSFCRSVSGDFPLNIMIQWEDGNKYAISPSDLIIHPS